MDEIIGTIAERLGLDEGTVASVVEAVFGFLKDNPEKAVGLLADIPGLEGLGEISGLGDLEEFGSKLGKLFGG